MAIEAEQKVLHPEEERLKIFDRFNTGKDGLTVEEVAKRLVTFGQNRLPEEKIAPVWKIFLLQFASPLIYVLIFAAAVSFSVNERTDFYFILWVLMFNAVLGTVQEYSASHSAQSLKQMVEPRAVVVREGKSQEIGAADLVPGDVIQLQTGSKVPADAVLIDGDRLQLDESMLTGESLAVNKNWQDISPENSLIQERHNEIFAGTVVVQGSGTAVVSATALKTQLGRIADKLIQKSEAKAPLIIRMESFSFRLSVIIGVLVVGIAAIMLLLGNSWRETLLFASGLAVAAIPEGLPIAITIALAVGMNRMAKRNVIVKNLMAVEALGSCTMIASDKTGTLTVNELTITQLLDNAGTGHELQVNMTDCQQPQTLDAKIVLTSAIANEAGLHEGKFFGDPVDVAFLKLVQQPGLDPMELRKLHPTVSLLRYSSESRFSAGVIKIGGTCWACLKGAPELVLSHSNLSVEQRHFQEEKLDELSLDGLRVIGLAYGQVSEQSEYTLEDLQGLEFLGLAGMMDPLRPEAKEAVACCHKAGVKVAMITGDSPSTAHTIAEQLGLSLEDQHAVVTGEGVREARSYGDSALDEITANATVYARIEPTQKLDIVRSMMRNGNFVAVTGDGVNDAPAIKNANVGIAMGKGGTDVAKESASIVLTDDNFASIVSGIAEGRITYSNIRKVIFLLVAACFNGIGVILISLITGLPNPFSALQLLWLNLVTEGCNTMPLSFDQGEGDEMQKPPRKPSESVFDKIMVRRIVISSSFVTLACVIFYAVLLHVLHYDGMTARTMLITLMVLFEIVEVFNSCSESKSVLHTNFRQNPWVFFGVGLSLVLQILAMNVGFVARGLKFAPLSWQQWGCCLLISLSSLMVMELEKWHRKHYGC